ncbi:hypothetical protein Hdeb2414_s0007g00226701 [Helianthus debilis subsp. tardiflorus]
MVWLRATAHNIHSLTHRPSRMADSLTGLPRMADSLTGLRAWRTHSPASAHGGLTHRPPAHGGLTHQPPRMADSLTSLRAGKKAPLQREHALPPLDP